MFINDITSVLNCNVQMLRDDIKISLPICGKKDHLTLQQCIDNAVEWAWRNFVLLNHKKTVIAMYTYRTSCTMLIRQMVWAAAAHQRRLSLLSKIEKKN